MTENNQNVANIDDLLDGTLDDLSDVPSFKPFPVGAHTCKISWKVTAVSGIPSIELKLALVETVELKNPEDTPAQAGDETQVLFMLKKKDGTKNELAEGQWKEILASLKTGLNIASATNREVMSASEGLECLVSTGVRVNKKDPQDVKYYTSIESINCI